MGVCGVRKELSISVLCIVYTIEGKMKQAQKKNEL